jgi:hypothetical protein
MRGFYQGNIAEETVLRRFKNRGNIAYKVVRVIDGIPTGPYQMHYKYKRKNKTKEENGFHAWILKKDAILDKNDWKGSSTCIVLKVKISNNLCIGSSSYSPIGVGTVITGSMMEFIDWPFDNKGKK